MKENKRQKDDSILKYPLLELPENDPKKLEEKIKLLIADDEEDILDPLKIHLENKGFEVYTCKTGYEAINFIEKKGENIDACLTDIVLPGVPGDEIIKKIRAEYPDIKVGVMSGWAPSEETLSEKPELKELYDEGKYFSKPFDLEDLRKKILFNLMEKIPSRELPETALVMNDSSYEAGYIRNYLDVREGLSADIVENGAEALKRLRDKKYRFAVFDTVLKKEIYNKKPTDGVKFASIIKDEYPYLPIITTSKSPFLIPSGLGYHMQVKYINRAWKILEKVLDKKPAPVLLNDFNNISIVRDRGFIKEITKKDIQEIENITAIHGLEKKISDEQHYFSQGAGGRDKGYISENTALGVIVTRTLVCRELEKKYSVENIEPKIWKKINESEKKSQPMSFSSAALKVVAGRYERKPYIIVISGASCSGKSIAANKLEKRLNKEGDKSIYIGNIKTGKPRNKDTLSRDEYISKRNVEKFENDAAYTGYWVRGEDPNKKKFRKRYFSKDKDILDALKSNKNAIVIRNTGGLKATMDWKHKKGVEARLLSYRMIAPDEILNKRQEKRLENEEISQKEYEERNGTLQSSIDEEYKNSKYIDIEIDSNQPLEKEIEKMVNFKKNVEKRNLPLKDDLAYYLQDRILRLTGSNEDDTELEKKVKNQKVSLAVELEDIKEIEIMDINRHNGIYTLYLKPFYLSEDESSKPEFINYLEEKLGESAYKKNPIQTLDKSSRFSKTKIRYHNNRVLRLDDIALFSLYKDAPIPKTDMIHSIAFVCAENDPGDKKYNIINLED
ncbi:response regulator [Candidatus Woesearchaeota archaeon]|nr:response regulator [Candidatus Woesearchaeota archaeon]